MRVSARLSSEARSAASAGSARRVRLAGMQAHASNGAAAAAPGVTTGKMDDREGCRRHEALRSVITAHVPRAARRGKNCALRRSRRRLLLGGGSRDALRQFQRV